MDQERIEMIVKLQRLEAQVRSAIDYLQSDMPLYPLDQPDRNETPNVFHIGDFTITDRFDVEGYGHTFKRS